MNYLGETYIYSGHTVSEMWNDGTNETLSNISKSSRFIIMHVDGSTEFVRNSLNIFQSATKSGDYHDEINS